MFALAALFATAILLSGCGPGFCLFDGPSCGIVASTPSTSTDTTTTTPTTSSSRFIGNTYGTFGISTERPVQSNTGEAYDSPHFVIKGSYIYIGSTSSPGRISKYNFTTGQYLGWVGGVGESPTSGAVGCAGAAVGSATPGWCFGGMAESGSGDAHFASGVRQLGVDSDGNLFATDQGNARVHKFDSVTGAYLGWIGRVLTTPTGGAAGCSTTPLDSATPGWCFGGTAKSGPNNGQFQLYGLFMGENDVLYVADTTNRRIVRVDRTTGAFDGWIGRILTSPTSPPACVLAAGNATPQWCYGGTPQSGTGNGHFNTPFFGYVSATGDMFVSDEANNRLVKYDATNGTFVGWIGRINASPTSPPACVLASGNITPTWCSGGTASGSFGLGNGALYQPAGVSQDASGNIYVVMRSGALNKYDSTGAFLGWIGTVDTTPTGGAAGCTTTTSGHLTPGWCTGGTYSQAMNQNGFFTAKTVQVHTDGYLYVADYYTGIRRIDPATGQFLAFLGLGQNANQGWVSAGPFGDRLYGDGGINDPLGFTVKNGYIYVANTYRLDRFDLSTGLFSGWTGIVGTTPSGGTVGSCTSTGYASSAPAWCTGGGEAPQVQVDGSIYSQAMMYATTNHIYVADTLLHRVEKFNVDGSYYGWIGRISTAPTGGLSTCNGTAAGNITPGWCTGGRASGSTADGNFNSPKGLYVNETTDYLYIVDNNNFRIQRWVASTGVFSGWIGNILNSPTGGDAGCNGAGVGTFTPGWCRGGRGGTGTGDGMFTEPSNIWGDGTYLYVSDNSVGRVLRFQESTGAFKGWIGKIATSPTSGETGCAGAAVGTATPGWCYGGTAATGTGDGMFDSPESGFIHDGYMYVPDYDLHRVSKFTASTGAFVGWRGKTLTVPTAGPASCLTLSAGDVTPTWCQGGTSQKGTEAGAFKYPSSVNVTSDGNLYILETGGGRIQEIQSGS